MSRVPARWPLVAALLLGCTAEQDTADTGTPYACASDDFDWGAGGEHMLPGTRCLDCHRVGGSATESPMTLAGTVFVAPHCPEPATAATVHVVDAEGVALALPTNEVGNFFTDVALTPPLSVAVEIDGQTTSMVGRAQTGSCALCHGLDTPPGLVWGR